MPDETPTGPGGQPPARPGKRNLLDNRVIGGFVRSGWYPDVFQWLTLVIFLMITADLLLGPESPGTNWGTAMTWVLWWPLIPLFFLFLGRFWCAICPFAKLSDLVQTWVGNQRPVPRFLKSYGAWLIIAGFLAITWADHVWGMMESPWGSGMLMLVLTTGAIISGALWQRRTFCRHICPLGGMCGNYSRAAMVELRGTPEICATCDVRACYVGTDKAPGCPLFEFPKNMESSANCVLCGDCVKNCPNDSIRVTTRPPFRELWFIKRPRIEEASLAIVIAGMVFVQNITMLSIWEPLLKRIAAFTGTDSLAVDFSVFFAVVALAPMALLALAALVARVADNDSVRDNFMKFGYAIIPLVMGSHMGHNLFHLLAEGKSIYYTAIGLGGGVVPGGSTALVSTGTLVALQFVLIALGALASLYAAYRIARSNYGSRAWAAFAPYAVLIVLLTAASVWLLRFPMAMRM